MARSIRQALRDYCNLNSDLADLAVISKQVGAEDKQYLAEMKRQTHEYMQTHHVDCFLDGASGKFVYRASRLVPRPLSAELEEMILAEIDKAEQEGKLVAADVEAVLLDVVTMIQKIRSHKTESLRIGPKKPTSIKDVVEPKIKEVRDMLSKYVALTDQTTDRDTAVSTAKKIIKEKLTEIVPAVKDYCAAQSIVKKATNFPRRWTAVFTSCVNGLLPDYFSTVKKHTARRYLQYKQSKARNCKVTSLRPSKTHITDILTDLARETPTGWTHLSMAKRLFKRLHEEAEQTIVTKLAANDTAPVFKVSLGASLGLNEDE